ncbi:MAG: hypothetical protein ACRDRU_16725 [Pseudonocardiaceae bacterium]
MSDTVSSDTVSFTELDEQHVELLAARTVLSMFSAVGEGVIPPVGGGGLGETVTTVTQLTGLGAASTPGSTGGAASGT